MRDTFPTGVFNCWGVPELAADRFRETAIGDVVFFVPKLSVGVVAFGVVKLACPITCHRASAVLWPDAPDDRRFPHVFFFDSEIGALSWKTFLDNLRYKPNWNPRGFYRYLKRSHFTEWGGVAPYVGYLQREPGFVPLSPGSSTTLRDEELGVNRAAAEGVLSNEPGESRARVWRSIAYRRGQSEFRRRLLCAYSGRCAISACNADAALEAAHIRPYCRDGENDFGNGLLLRA
ncbi:MAG: HNH endonuclease, partial [Nannocystaceae bacterium]